MRDIRLLLPVLALAALAACQKSQAPASEASLAAAGGGRPAAAPAAAPAAPAAGGSLIHGTVKEKIDSGGYSYLHLAGSGGETWAAVPVAQVQVGAEVDVAAQMTMDGFESKTLNRKFDKLIFGTIAGPGGAAPAPALAGAPAPSGMPGTTPGAGFVAAAAAGKDPHAGMAAAGGAPAAPAAPAAPIKVEKAAGKDARTIAEVFAQKAKLKDAQVLIRGKVVKYNEGILGKNWVHLKDGTGAAGSDDLTVTTQGRAALGDVITVRGVVHLDKDFGAGYAYGVIVEDATVEKVGL